MVGRLLLCLCKGSFVSLCFAGAGMWSKKTTNGNRFFTFFVRGVDLSFRRFRHLNPGGMAWHRRPKVPNHQLQEWHLDAEKKSSWKLQLAGMIALRGVVGWAKNRQGRKILNRNFFNINLLGEYHTWHHLKVVVLQGRHQQKSSQNYLWYLIFEYCLCRTFKGADFIPSSILDQHSMVVNNGSASTWDLEPSVVF